MLQLVFTRNPLVRTKEKLATPAASSIVALFDCFSFDSESYEINFLLTEEDRIAMVEASLFVTLCATL